MGGIEAPLGRDLVWGKVDAQELDDGTGPSTRVVAVDVEGDSDNEGDDGDDDDAAGARLAK